MKIVVAIYSCVNDDDGYGLMMTNVDDGVYDGEGRHVDIHDYYCYGGGWDGLDGSTYPFVHHVHYYSCWYCPRCCCRIIDGLFHPHVVYVMVNNSVGMMTNWR